MTTRFPSPFLILPLLVAGCAAKAPPGAPPPPVAYAEGILYNADGAHTGTVTLTPEGDHLKGYVEVTGGLAAGAHGMHIHTVGECKLKDFASAGGHLNPTGKQHGMQNPNGPHQGDLPMLTADAGGMGKSSFTAPTTLDTLFDADGSSFVIHAGVDDMKTDPAGNSGARVMCAVLYRKQM